MSPRTVTLLTAGDCALCEHAKRVLTDIGADRPLVVREVSLDTAEGRALAVEHGVGFAPGVLLDGRLFAYGRLSERKLRRALSSL